MHYVSFIFDFNFFCRVFDGRATEADWLEESHRLAELLRKDPGIDKSYYYTAFYDPPYQLFHRTNEIWMARKSVKDTPTGSLPPLTMDAKEHKELKTEWSSKGVKNTMFLKIKKYGYKIIELISNLREDITSWPTTESSFWIQVFDLHISFKDKDINSELYFTLKYIFCFAYREENKMYFYNLIHFCHLILFIFR